MVDVQLVPRNDKLAQLIEQYGEGLITYSELEKSVAGLGFRTTYLYDMVSRMEFKK